jgi:pyruvate/2-oxoglutarate dehydrogenase complex dihydrolipoamide acyltransferase (E2) component
MKFRKEAVAHSNQATLDLPVRLTSPRGWIVLLLIAVLVVGGGVWGSSATLPRTVAASGLITSARGVFSVQTLVSGQVTKVLVERGDEVRAYQPVAELSNGKARTTVRAPAAGRIFSLAARVGLVVEAGSTLATAERSGTADDRLVAVVYVPGDIVTSIQAGSQVDLTVANVPVTTFGVLRGQVSAVDGLESTRRDISDFLGDDELAASLTAGGPRYRVLVDLATARTPSGYQWSTTTGPPFRIGSRAPVLGEIAQPPVRPMDWVMPK